MARTKLFRSNRSQAVRLPKEVAFPEGVKDVTILREGARRVMRPGQCGLGRFLRCARRRPARARSAERRGARRLLMLRFLLDTNLCIRVLERSSAFIARPFQSRGRRSLHLDRRADGASSRRR